MFEEVGLRVCLAYEACLSYLHSITLGFDHKLQVGLPSRSMSLSNPC